MCKKLMLLSCLVTLLGLSNIAFAEFEVFKADFSCSGEATKKGGGWIDLTHATFCDGQRHDPITWTDVAGTNIDIRAGHDGGHGNIISRSGDPICNSTWDHFYGVDSNDNIRLELKDLDPDTTYTVYTYHAWDEGYFYSVNPVTIEGAVDPCVITPPQVVNTTSDATLLEYPGVIKFTTDSGPNDVRIKFNGRVRFNAFALYSEAAMPQASLPNPGYDEPDVCPKDLQLSWTPGGATQTTAGHDVYFGTDYNDVRDANRSNHPAGVLYSEGQDSNEYPEDGDPCLQLELMTTYYWRVDEINDTDTWTGFIWLTWTPSCSATGHKLYFGTDFHSFVLFGDGFEGGFGSNWTAVGWEHFDANSVDPNLRHSGDYSARATGAGVKTLTSDDIDATDYANAIGVSFWVRTTEPMGADELQLDYYNGSSYIPVSDFNIAELDPNGRWVQFTDTITDSNYLISNFQIRLTADISSGTVYVDDVNVSNAWPVDPIWLETDLGGADNNYAPTLSKFTHYYWRVDTVIGGDVLQGEYRDFKTGFGGLLLEMLFDGGTPGNDLPATVTDSSSNSLVFTTYAAIYDHNDDPNATGSAKYADGRYTGTSVDIDPTAGLYRKDPCGPNDPPDLLRLDGYQYTIEFWTFLPEAGYTEMGFFMMVGKQDGPWKITINDPTDNDDIRWYHRLGEKKYAIIAGGILPEIFDEWAHVCAVYDQTLSEGGESQRLYINAELEEDGNDPYLNPADNNNPVGIGVGVRKPAAPGGSYRFDWYFEGKIDELRIWDIALEPVLEAASSPYPPDKERGIEANDPNLAKFMWKPGAYVQSMAGHKLYFGDSIADVNESADPCVILDSNSWTHNMTFEKGTVYYWRVDEVNGTDVWIGNIWWFETKAELYHPNIVLYYPFDETSGRDVYDYSGYYFDAIAGQGNPFPYPEMSVWEPNNGRFDGCINFNVWQDPCDPEDWDENPGDVTVDDDHIPAIAALINKEISVCVWLNADPNQWTGDDDEDENVVFEYCDNDLDAGWNENITDSKLCVVAPDKAAGDLIFRAGNGSEAKVGGDVLRWNDFNADSIKGGWNHFVFIKDENEGKMYIYLNNELVASKQDCNTSSLAKIEDDIGDVEFVIGCYEDNEKGYDGKMDDFQVYNIHLNAQQIETIFRGGELETAWSPSPADGQDNVSYNADLTWKAGAYTDVTDGHELFFGTNYNEVFDANTTASPNVVHRTLTDPNFDPNLLELGQTYYWRIDEVNDPCVYTGRIWSFTVAEFFIIDDFEDYTENPNPITNGWEVVQKCNLSLATEDEEWWIQPRGWKSMEYKGFSFQSPYYSEAQSKFVLDPNDWTILDNKMKILTLWFYGLSNFEGSPTNPCTATERWWVELEDIDNDKGRVWYPTADATDFRQEEWLYWDIPLSDFNDANPNLDLNKLLKIHLGFGDGTPGVGQWTVVYWDDIWLVPAYCIPSKRKPQADISGPSDECDCQVDYYDLDYMVGQWLESDCNCIEEYGSMPAPQGEPNLVAWYEFDDGSDSQATTVPATLWSLTAAGSRFRMDRRSSTSQMR
jgi:hypothetical protein